MMSGHTESVAALSNRVTALQNSVAGDEKLLAGLSNHVAALFFLVVKLSGTARKLIDAVTDVSGGPSDTASASFVNDQVLFEFADAPDTNSRMLFATEFCPCSQAKHPRDLRIG